LIGVDDSSDVLELSVVTVFSEYVWVYEDDIPGFSWIGHRERIDHKLSEPGLTFNDWQIRADVIYLRDGIIPVRLIMDDHQIIKVPDASKIDHIDFIVTEPEYLHMSGGMFDPYQSHILAFVPDQHGTDVTIIISKDKGNFGFDVELDCPAFRNESSEIEIVDVPSEPSDQTDPDILDIWFGTGFTGPCLGATTPLTVGMS
jgi:hypothetical protein